MAPAQVRPVGDDEREVEATVRAAQPSASRARRDESWGAEMARVIHAGVSHTASQAADGSIIISS